MTGQTDRAEVEPGDTNEPDAPAAENEAPEESKESFDPTPYLHSLRGRGGPEDYLDVRHRLLWLRREHPDAHITTEHIQIDAESAIFRAQVTIPGGGSASGHGSETARDFTDYIEKAETKALGRALNALGYGAQFAESDDDPLPRAAARPPQRLPVRAPESPRPAPPPRPAGPPPPPVRASAPAQVESLPQRRPDPAPTGEPALEDYSWTAFWKWARPLGFDNRDEIEDVVGQSIGSLNPAQVRQLLVEAGRGG